MDKMIEKESEIKTKIFENTQRVSPNEPINILFFDVTTLYFEFLNIIFVKPIFFNK